MTLAEFQRRAYAAGCAVRVSGAVYFYTRDGVTVRATLKDGAPHYAVSHMAKGHDITFMPCTVAQASKALKLPRKG